MSIDRLRSYFGFSALPFGKALAPGQLHQHAGHAEAVARIGWLIEERALGMISGEVGSGKTVAVRAAVSTLDASRHTIIYIGCPAIGARGLYAAIVTALGGTPRYHKASLIPQTQDALVTEHAERGRRVLVVCDEAHLLDASQLEELRMLTNADIDSRSALACLLVGQPTLRRRVKMGQFAALDQRIAVRYAMAPLTLAETGAYLQHHLSLVGRTDRVFSDDAVARIHEVSRGLPRAVNNLATAALIATFAANKTIADEQAARQAIAETDHE